MSGEEGREMMPVMARELVNLWIEAGEGSTGFKRMSSAWLRRVRRSCPFGRTARFSMKVGSGNW